MTRELQVALKGLPFTKMTGSGNDFVFFDGREVDKAVVTTPEAIAAICNRFNGIGGDGVVVLEPSGGTSNARILYFNSDGSPADLCGNATLCSTTLSVALGLGEAEGLTLETPAGAISARIKGGLPQINIGTAMALALSEPLDLAPGELRVGFVVAGIPHLVVLVDSVNSIDLSGRGPILRRHPATGAAGANVNWVSRLPNGNWRYRTYERGVEGETLACGTGAIATAVQLVEWGEDSSPVTIQTSSSKQLMVELAGDRQVGWRPSLRGEGRIVFSGVIGDVF